MTGIELTPGTRVFIQGGSATPKKLIELLVESLDALISSGFSEALKSNPIEIVHIHTEAPPLYAQSKYKPFVRVKNFFVGANMREYLNYDDIDYLPCFLSEIPQLLKTSLKPDIALVQVSPPDAHGYCTLGTSVDVARTAVDEARVVVAQVNEKMPRVHGDGFIHKSRFWKTIESKEELFCVEVNTATSTELSIAKHVASVVEDGSTLQMGIGAIPNAVAQLLVDRRHLGIHSEMWSDGTLKLLECGAVDNSLKRVHAGKTVSSFVIGSRRLYDFIDDNPSVVQMGADYVNNLTVIMRNPRVVAINSAVEIDLTGQVCADSVGSKIISGVGGQMDFMRGAALSLCGRPVIAIPSRTVRGKSKIVSQLSPGAGVVTTRAHVHYVASEYGIVNLHGRTLGERAKALIEISHPEDRERLEREWHKITKVKS